MKTNFKYSKIDKVGKHTLLKSFQEPKGYKMYQKPKRNLLEEKIRNQLRKDPEKQLLLSEM